jgi:hypothetical protein
MLSKTGARTAALRCFIYNGRRVVHVEHIAVSGTPTQQVVPATEQYRCMRSTCRLAHITEKRDSQ